MAGFISGGGDGGIDYVQDTAPVDPENGDLWADTSGTPHVLKEYDTGAAAWEAQVTDTRFSSHETAASAHHSRPTGTQTANPKNPGYFTLNDGAEINDNTGWYSIGTPDTADGVELEFPHGTSQDMEYTVQIKEADGSTFSKTWLITADTGSVFKTWNWSARQVQEFAVTARKPSDGSIYSGYGAIIDLHLIGMPAHNHSI